jgi:hypothetical protein
MKLRKSAAAIIAPALALALSLATRPASAHIDLNEPPARFQDPLEDQKDGPCGAAGGRANETALVAGQIIQIQWDEPIEHESYFRLAFLEDGDAFPNPVAFDEFCDPDLDDWCIEDNIEDGEIEGSFTYEWVVPDITCDNCTLQLIQVMLDDDGLQEDDLYFDCADVTIAPEGGSTSASTSASAGGGAGDGGAPGVGGGGTGNADDGGGDGDGDGDADGDGPAATGAGGAAAATSTAAGEPLQPTTFPPDEGCAVEATGARSGLGAVAIAFGLAGLALARRRRSA